jgi:hypothetical protein
MSHKSVIGIAVIALIGLGVYLYLKYKKVKTIQSPLPQQYDPVNPPVSTIPTSLSNWSTLVSVAPFTSSNI